MTQNIPSKDRFQQTYEVKAPWDIGKPQTVFVEAADQITGSILDAGCGTGENALFFAERGRDVTGIDFLEYPIAEAKRKAQERGLAATFLVMDALHLVDISEVFDSVIVQMRSPKLKFGYEYMKLTQRRSCTTCRTNPAFGRRLVRIGELCAAGGADEVGHTVCFQSSSVATQSSLAQK